MIIVVGMFYAILNLIGTKVRGNGIYPILNWDDKKSLLILLGIFLMTIFLFFALYYLNKVKFRYLAKRRA